MMYFVKAICKKIVDAGIDAPTAPFPQEAKHLGIEFTPRNGADV